ncbi:MAG: AAA family ATPase, partial [Pseudomonadota bacterium]
NTVADQYVADQLEAKFEAARRATTWLMGRVASLRERVEQSAAAVQAYTNENQTGDSQAASITQQQIAQLSAELINAKAQEAEARAKYDQARQTVESLGAFSAATSLTSPLIVTLRGQRTELARREAELSNRYGPKHPSMIEVRSEIRDIDGAIVGEVRQILNSRQGDVRVAEARVAALTQGLSELEGKASGQSEASVGLAQLEAEAEANRRIYDNFLERLNETREQEGFQTPDSRVIEPASPAYAPFMPRTKVTTGLGGIAGGALGFGFVVFLRLMNRSVRTAEAVSDKTGLPVLASIPRIKRRHKGRNLLPYLAKRPNSELAEAARYLRNAILTRGDDIRSVLITSALPEEGKMTLAILLAQIMAGMNKSVLVIDADFRRPKISDTLGLEPDKDLVSVLSSEAPLNDAIYRAADAAFDTIPLKAGQADRSDLLGLSRMKAMVAFLGERYDVVIIEGPPVLGVGDFSVLGRIVDTSIVAVEWNRTPVAAVEQTVDWLADHQAHVLGAVLNKVDVRRAAQYGATGYEAHYAAVQRYYLN